MKAKVSFSLSQDEDGYPPFTSESVWAIYRSDNVYMLDNIPLFAREATVGDIVEATEIEGVLWFKALITSSGNSLLRVQLMGRTDLDDVRARLAALGCNTEVFRRLIGVNVPPGTNLAIIRRYLDREASRGTLDYEEPILRVVE